MTIDQLAENALASVRSWYKTGVKSNNKRRAMPTDAHRNAEEARIYASSVLQSKGIADYYLHGALAHGESMASRQRAGNCWDLAVAAMAAAVRLDRTQVVRVIAIPAPGDHAFLTIGGTLEEVLRPFLVAHQGHSNYCICDPWANIACRGHLYLGQFYDKMGKWKSHGKQIYYDGAWRDADDHGWKISMMLIKQLSHEELPRP
tara:strand:- start:250 stop:858 length:609 start_codon:yes stop_codon:yes gene_type:complete